MKLSVGRSFVGRGRRVLPALAVPLLVGSLLVGSLVAAAAPAGADPIPTGATVADLCGNPAPGQARCLSERLIPSARTQAATTGLAPASTPGGLGPSDLAAAYQLDTSKGYGQTVAVVDAYDDPNAAADLAVYRNQYGLPACTLASGCFSKVNQAGATSPMPAASTGWAGEISLDLDMVSAVCPQCDILLVEANSSYLSDLGTAVDTAVRLGAKFVSNSYGGGEYSGVSGNDVHYNHPGVAITASTGDNGYGVSYPASSPYVTAVGGTSLVRSAGGRGWTETAWAGAGSGCSGYSSQPSMQAGLGTGCPMRALADVSAVANPNTGVAVYVTYGGGGWGVYGGTSASSPIIASVYALAGTPGSSDYPNSYPYRNTSSLFDVTAGTNGSCLVHQQCSAGAGWDGPTGLGSPDTAAAFSATGSVSGTPVKFGATGQVSGPVIAGLSTPISATALLPDGDSLASISWKSARSDCMIAAPSALSTAVSCPASAAGSSSVSATLVDSLGASKVVTLALAFAAQTVKRAVTVAFNVAGQSGSGQSLCTGAASPIRALVTDTATGQPVKGLAVSFSRQPAGGVPSTVGSALSGADGTANSSVASTVALTLAAKSAAAGAFSANAGTSLPVSVGKCLPALSGSADKSISYYGDPVLVTATLTRDAGGQPVALPGANVQILNTVAGRAVLLASAVTGLDGMLHAVVHPSASGVLGLSLPASTSWNAATTSLGTLTVLNPSTSISAVKSSSDVGYGASVLVSGTLSRITNLTSPLAGAVVSVKLAPASGGAASVLGSAVVSATGTWSVTVRPRAAGTVSAVYAGGPGLPAATADAGALQVGTWASTVSLTAQLSAQLAGTANRVSGVLTRSYAGNSEPASSVQVGIYLQTSAGSQLLLATVASTATGTFSATVAPTESGSLLARIHGVPGYTDSSSAASPVTVTSKVLITAPSVLAAGIAVPITITVTAARAGTATVQLFDGSNWQPILTGLTSTSGRLIASVAGLSTGSHQLRVSFAGDARGATGTSASLTVLIR